MIPLGDWKMSTDASAWLAAGSTVVGAVTIGARSSIWYGAILRGDGEPITIGESSNVQDGAVLHTDPGFPVSIGDRVSIGHRAVLHGCTIGDEVLIGMSATIMNGAVVGAGSLVAAGALISEGVTIPPGSLVLGAPAKVRREVSGAEREMISRNAATYEQLMAAHREHQGAYAL